MKMNALTPEIYHTKHLVVQYLSTNYSVVTSIQLVTKRNDRGDIHERSVMVWLL